MDYQALKTELTTDPLARGYASMTDQQAADSLNVANISVKVDVPFSTVIGTLYVTGAWNNIISLSLDGKTGVAAHDAALASAIALKGFSGTFYTSQSSVYARAQTDLGNLVTEGTITAQDETNVLNLTNANVTRASQIGWGVGVTAADVTHARSI